MATKQQQQRFEVGDRVFDPKYGFGVVKKVHMEDRQFPYYVDYEDGTKIWYRADHAVPASEVPPDSKPTYKQKRK